MKQYVKGTQRDYSLSFKLAVVEQVEKGEMTYRQALERYGIQGGSTVLKWLRKYGQLDWQSSAQRSAQGELMTKSRPNSESKSLSSSWLSPKLRRSSSKPS